MAIWRAGNGAGRLLYLSQLRFRQKGSAPLNARRPWLSSMSVDASRLSRGKKLGKQLKQLLI
eukprot:5617538-Heterocapsa_arctica.AAC.1